jgi:hypothetical protein
MCTLVIVEFVGLDQPSDWSVDPNTDAVTQVDTEALHHTRES